MGLISSQGLEKEKTHGAASDYATPIGIMQIK